MRLLRARTTALKTRKTLTRADPGGDVPYGKVVGIFGLRGELRIHLFNRESELFSQERLALFVSEDGQRSAHRLRLRSGAGGRILGRVEGLTDREEARKWIGRRIHVRAEELPTLEPDHYYHRDLIGLQGVDEEGRSLGQLSQIHPGEVEIWEFRGSAPEPLFVPALKEHILQVSLEEGQILLRVDADD